MLIHINIICLHISEKSCTFVVEKKRKPQTHTTMKYREMTQQQIWEKCMSSTTAECYILRRDLKTEIEELKAKMRKYEHKMYMTRNDQNIQDIYHDAYIICKYQKEIVQAHYKMVSEIMCA